MDHLKSPLSARNIPAEYKSAIIHAYGNWQTPIAAGKHDFINKLDGKLKFEGISTYLVEGASRTGRALLAEPHIHILVGGPAMYGPNIMHANPSYLWGFWYFDEVGHGSDSSIKFTRFAPEDVHRENARFFYNGVSSHMIRGNISKIPQEERMDAPLKSATATVFCQPKDALNKSGQYLSTEQMIAASSRYDRDALVYVKPHPYQTQGDRKRLLDFCEDFPNVKLTDASIHDLIEASRVVVTHNSSVGFEALMQRKPVITCAKSDYWHATLTPKTTDELRDAIEFGPETMRDFDFEGYFFWFLEKHSYEPAKPNFSDRIWARLRDKLMLK